MRKIRLLVVLLLAAAYTVGCGMSADRGWAEGHGALPDRIGKAAEPGQSVVHEIGASSEVTQHREPWQIAGYGEPTGRWFLHNGRGVFGYGLTTGTQRAGDEFQVKLIGHDPGGTRMERNVRIRLSERTDDGGTVLMEEMVRVDVVNGDETLYAARLPERENAVYFLSAEVLNESGDVEDSMVTRIDVPAPEINALLISDRQRYDSDAAEAVFTLHNDGPTRLLLGTPYTIEKMVDGVWRQVPGQEAFPAIGILVEPGKSFTQSVQQLERYGEGTYRFVKEIKAEGLDLSAVLAAEFSIGA